jgi:hypothetical protein
MINVRIKSLFDDLLDSSSESILTIIPKTYFAMIILDGQRMISANRY